MSTSELCFYTATELAHEIRSGQISAREVMDAHLAQIAQVNPKVNAVVSMISEKAQADAAAADERQAAGEELPRLHGLPIAHKELTSTAGLRTTQGSPIFADNVPTEDAIIVERLKRGGAITVGKTNAPEFGAGSQTFNPIFGSTLNPYDLTRTCGGSSGGAAVALACGMIPIADGSDMGGSLRNPAGFCNVAGFRPSPGRVPQYPALVGWFPIPVSGPMARTVEDIALMLSVIAGPDDRAPLSISEPPDVFNQRLTRDFNGMKIAWSHNLNHFPVDSRVTQVIDRQRHVFADLGCEIVDREPDFRDADEIFKTLRAWHFQLNLGGLLAEHRERMKDTVIWNIEAGEVLSGIDIGVVEKKRMELYHRVRIFLEEHNYLIMPVSQVPPFPVTEEYVTEIDGQAMETYIDWMKSCYYISTIGLPAISVPCGFTDEGLPVGVQIVGRHHDDIGVLQLAHAFQEATGFWRQRPAIASE